MRTWALAAVMVLGGCGPKPAACTATFSGNFSDSSSGSCPTFEPADGGWVFRFHADARAVNSALNGSIAFGPGPVPSSSSSQTAPSDWSALLTREPGCVYAAGRGAVPSGTFVLTLESGVPPHGTLELRQYVHSLPMADCGPGDVETIRFEF